MNKGETVERNERLKKRNERDRARRASETPQQKQERLRKRRERDNAKLPQQKQESLRKRRESERAVLAVEETQRKQERLRKRRERDQVTRLETRRLEEKVPISVPTAGKRQHADLRATATVLQEKRHRLASEEEDSRASRLESLRGNFAERMEVETEEESFTRLEHMSHIQQLRLSTETNEERTARLENMSQYRELRRSSEVRADRFEASAAQIRSQAEARLDRHLPVFEQHHVQARMRHFHQEIATIESPICSTCMEKFPGMKVNGSECLRCTCDKHVPKLYSDGNNMHPGVVPSQLQVNNNDLVIRIRYDS